MDEPALSGSRPCGRDHRWTAGLIALWLLASAIVAYFALGVARPGRYQDEFLLWGVSKSLAAGTGFSWRGSPMPLVSALYPLLVAPVFRIATGIAAQYEALKIVNSLVISSVVFPVYLGARILVARPFALLAAGFSIAVPAMVYASMIATENLAYPVGAAALLAIVWALSEGSRRSAAAAIALILLAILTRVQFASLPIVAAGSLVVGGLLSSDGVWGYVKRRSAFSGALGALALLGLVYLLVRGVLSLGIYQSTFYTTRAGMHDVVYWLRAYISDLYVMAAILPVIATFALLGVGERRRDPKVGALLAVALVASAVFIAQMTWFSSINTEDWRARGLVYERYMFYLGPLFFIGLVASLGRVTTRAAAGSTLVAVLALLLFPGGAVQIPFSIDAFGQTYYAFLAADHDWMVRHPGPPFAALALVLGGVYLLTTLRPERESAVRIGRLLSVVLPLFILLVSQAKAWNYQQIFRETADRLGAQPRDWIERATGEEVAMLVTGGADPIAFHDAEFWNGNVTRYYVNPRVPISTRFTFSPRCTLVVAADGAIQPTSEVGCASVPRAWLVVSRSLSMALRDARSVTPPRGARGLALEVSAGSPRVLAFVSGRDVESGEVTGQLQVWRYLERAGELRVDAVAENGPVTVTGPAGFSRRIARGERARFVVPLPAGHGRPTTLRVRGAGGAPGRLSVDRAALREAGGTWQPLF